MEVGKRSHKTEGIPLTNVELRLHLFNFGSGERIAGHAHILLDLTNINAMTRWHREEDIVKLITQDPIMDYIMANVGIIDKSFLWVSKEVVFTDLDKLPKNQDLDNDQYGIPEYAVHRIADILCVSVKELGDRTKIGIFVIDVKTSRSRFSHDIITSPLSSGRGRGWGQPLRNSLGAIHVVKSMFPQLSDDDIEVSCIVITAKFSNHRSILTVDGDIVVSSEPVSRVLPYAGRLCYSNAQIFRLIRRIKDQ